MELWIRSQDRESMFEVQNVFYSTDNESKHLIRTIVANDIPKGIIELGQYSTKERALEVLDEIQNILYAGLHATNNNQLAGITSIVYLMPKE